MLRACIACKKWLTLDPWHCARSWNLINNEYVTVKIVNLTLLCNVFVKSFKMTSLVKMRTLLSKNTRGNLPVKVTSLIPKKSFDPIYTVPTLRGSHTRAYAPHARSQQRDTHTYVRTHTHTTRLHNSYDLSFFHLYVMCIRTYKKEEKT